MTLSALAVFAVTLLVTAGTPGRALPRWSRAC